jgi:TRAP-type C4-dicarboxylate transport system substrate-binding protein
VISQSAAAILRGRVAFLEAMKPRLALTVALAIAAFCVPGAAQTPAESPEVVEIRIATLAPSGSSWMRVFNAWNLTILKQTNKTLRLRFYPGGSQGDERDFVRKMRAGQVDGAALTTTGLGQLVRQILVLSVPGVFTDYDQLDRVRAAMDERFAGMFDQEGYTLLGWGDVGKTRLFSMEEILRPQDIKRLRPWAWKDDLIFTEFLKIVGANPVRLGVPEVYPALQTKMVDTLPASALAAVSLQWFTRLKYVSAQNSGIIVGATVLKKKKFESLSDEHKKVLMDTSSRAHAALNKSIRRDDDQAYQTVLKRGLTAVDTTETRAEWDAVSAQVRERLTGRIYPKSLLDSVLEAAENQL